jgi:hypothetical protein
VVMCVQGEVKAHVQRKGRSVELSITQLNGVIRL